mgnify:CR=1 FL=1
MSKLTYEARENHLDKQSKLKEAWENITKKKKGCNKDQSSIRKEIFDVLSKKNYDTSFEIRQRDTYFQESYRYYNDAAFYAALKTIKIILGKTKLRDKTIDKIIFFIKKIEALKEALDTSSIQMKREELLTQKANLTPYYRDKDGVGRIDFFWEQEKAIDRELNALKEQEKTQLNITKPEPKGNNNQNNETWLSEQDIKEDEGRDESNYSNRLRDH